jgi:nucleoside-diphosphate kinase
VFKILKNYTAILMIFFVLSCQQETICATEQTLSIIKPDATRRNLVGKICARFEEKGLRIIAQKRMHLTYSQAEQFYAVHKGKVFFKDLCTFMSSGPVVVQVLQGENAVALNREIMGATNPAKAAEGTIRKDFAESMEANSVHGSDSVENATQEISYFFSKIEIVE